MSLGLPVPSPGALRALRQLALGTSCTVAFTTGLLAEDRRRRIHSAREVQENGRRIKSSRSYHGAAGAVAVANFEDHVLNPPLYSAGDGEVAPKSIASWGKDAPPKSRRLVRPQSQRELKDDLEPVVAKEKRDASHDADLRARTQSHATPIAIRKTGQRQSRQTVLAASMMETLEADNSAGGIESAASAFFESFENGLYIGKEQGRHESQLSKRLVTACGQLFDACQKHKSIGVYVPVIQKLLSLGPIEEDLFYELHAPEVIAHLLEIKSRKEGEDQGYLEAFHSASTMYMTEFSTKRLENPHPQMRHLGILLCAKAMKEQLYELTDSLYWRMSNIPSDEAPSCVDYLILANHGMGNHKSVLHYFRRFFVLTEPSKYELDEVVGAVLDSCLRKNALGKAEDVVRTGAEMARSGGFKIRAEWPMKVLGQHWRSTRDLASTRALFSRLETLVDCIDLPQALYSAIIQFCVEDGKDDQASAYLNQHTSANNGAASLRTCGHLALSKAMKEDWEGVESSLKTMKPLLVDHKTKEQHAQVFAPIFKLYTKSHSVAESEQFVRKAMEEYGLVPNIYVSNIMVGKYADANEIDSIPHWLETMRPFGLIPDAVSFNAMLSNYRDEWNTPFVDLLHLCHKMKDTDENLLDQCTARILREAAIRETKGDRFAFVRFSRQIDYLRQGQADSDSGLDFYPSMREAMSKGSPRKTLRIYHSALKREHIHIPPSMFALAIQAAVESHPADSSITALLPLVSSARERGVDISLGMARLLMHQLEDRSLDYMDLHSVLRKNTLLFADHGLTMPMGVATKVASVFSQRGLNRDALALWEYYAARNGVSRDLVDLSSLTVLMRVHIALENVEGVQWVMDTLERNGVVPSRRFMLVIKLGIANLRKKQTRWCGEGEVPRALREVLEEALGVVRLRRERHGVESRRVGGRLLDIMSAAVMESRGEEVVAAREHAGSVNATAEHQRETAGRLHEEESRATRGSPPPPAMWTAVSVTPLDRGVGSSGQKRHETPVMPLVENQVSPKPTYEYIEAEPRHHARQDAVRRVTSAGGVLARKVVSGWS
ncbi:hypothetical protein V501_01253 [Pseudogymnoascus sp. VKM F-4519 (FW-2642)]|nr:hypothetical protein V501_01253 [Pseudogymnoascus sp. VKM F-4519 (FW-2642)]